MSVTPQALMSQTFGGPPAKLPAPTAKVSCAFPLNTDQQAAVTAMQEFLSNGEDPFFLLKGPAGTGKTYCIKELVNRVRGRLVFTAPTNKATKVLRESVTTEQYTPDCRTIYSLLGLRLEANGEIKELTAPEDPIDLSKFIAVVVDEGSMVNQKLRPHIHHAAQAFGVQFIFMGDPAQLPPVGEIRSWIFQTPMPTAELTRVMRHDNQILDLATSIRLKVDHPAPSFQLQSNNDGAEGVWVQSQALFTERLKEYAGLGYFSKPNHAKAIAWRNVTVDSLNRTIRAEIFNEAAAYRWLESDRVVMLEPAKDPSGEQVAHTDDEGTVSRVNVTYHPTYGEFKCYALNVTFDDNHTGTVWLLHEDSERQFQAEVTRLASEARSNPRLWKKFWAFKESFHAARHGYAITSHRAQGSTYQIAFVDYRDILLNRNRQEAARCLYVATSRPKKELYLA